MHSYKIKSVMKHLILFIILSSLLFSSTHTLLSQTKSKSFPCRIHDDSNRDLFIMTLGDVRTPIAQGVFDPASDQVTLNNGSMIKNYYRDSLHYS